MKKVKAPDFIIFFTMITLLGIGIIMVFSSTSIRAYADYGDSFYFLKKQFLWSVIGIGAMIFFMTIDYKLYKQLAQLGLLVTLGSLILVLIIGTVVGGSQRWLGLGMLRVQPSEIAKLSMVIYMARYLSTKQHKIDKLQGLAPGLLVLGLVCGLILMQPDLGTAATIGGTIMIMFIAAGLKLEYLAGLGLTGISGIFYLIYSAPYRKERLLAFLDPWSDPLDSGFHIIQSLYALGSGGLFGVGIGQSRQKFFYLPEPGTDFIFAIIGEELGFIGAMVVVFLFFLFAWRGLKIAIEAPDLFGSLLAVGITTMITIQAIINIGVVTGSMPVTGITLPFISYGGSSLVIMLSGVGILLNISRYS
ncbi:stage V sporulation protein E [Selenihalanaerobacter shriftii]|uniref:Cell division-specific peptidoglycan biosynthesis regulator FtsW n=1 Tax=Selenihalanaerobacter shriftii TaxID=142842 RepID=A0A1T4JZ55_9FIRM|nr:stage V sporulation protein E [Selenihalanaerobacter shriftii]SJZ35532.1 cell division-specific peptidoglycan biosynthesis regulator FtsW [Selenihalanaerobacter shriftii]